MRPLKWGQFDRRVCWLVRPSALDVWLPEDHTLEYVLTDLYSMRGRPPMELVRSIDREYVQEKSRAFHSINRPHCIVTYWYDPQGNRVKKMDVIRRRKAEFAIEDTGRYEPPARQEIGRFDRYFKEPVKLVVVDLITGEEHIQRALTLKKRLQGMITPKEG